MIPGNEAHVALVGGEAYFDRAVSIFQPAYMMHEARHGPMKLREELLTDRPLMFERFLVPPSPVEPDERRWQINKRDPIFARHL